jgi:hypothetical protein
MKQGGRLEDVNDQLAGGTNPKYSNPSNVTATQ